MGRVRPRYIKSLGDKLLEMYPDRFTDSFEENKKAVAQLADIPSKRVRNRVAGYITRLVKRRKAQEKAEAAA
ncbi:30S ribosomal protein S17e [Pyrobaculum neutrophilum]|uniref:Small ribosomal subunit protein eS17 n=1 Tax=Pyrobaculum neutrophilum (strain DSM 2338 / JCM 9278 / NBRC 100436 / V24Sta) TaxID=444157 RepID=RS17E_PYRNV|nr:30S ribosomal protein S17e [Pyrobaculum neutrophilum]B1YA34.1 RecName: Full=Small ribosomal subunit protein eS17; AltName: Full=30S ribosomal protein S17e [Pyrobaculum neutrophilum V24Sta]ACB39008.1 30S ribosomal protein S17e [Pyrobaculum neutrophilum V24Sta]